MECASTILGSIFSTAAGYLVEPILRHGRYLFCFECIIKELEEEDKNLRLAQESVQNEVATERRNANEISSEAQNWLMEASNVVANVRSLKQEIDANDSRLNGWCSNWCCKYKLSRRAAEQKSILLKLQAARKSISIAYPAVPLGIEFLAPKDYMTFKSRKFAFVEIIKALKDDKTSIVGLYGMGGLGKTTLAKAVGNVAIKQKLFYKGIMVVVSQNVDIMSLQDQIADSLGLKLEEKSEQGRAERLFRRLKSGEKILLILDDMWKMLDLTAIGIPSPDEHKTCKILMTTRFERVCIAMKCQKNVLLKILEPIEGMDLIKKHVSVSDDSTMLNNVAIKMLEECNGLPLAIVTVGRLLNVTKVEDWEAVYRKLKMSKLDEVEGVEIDVYACLKLSYDYLKSNETKSCFLLCSLFPDDYKIDLEELLSFGRGLHLFQDCDSINDARGQLRAIINYLKDSCLLLDAGEEGFVKMHDLTRDVALQIASKEENVFMVKAGMRLAKWPQLKDIEQCTAISLMQSQIDVFPNQLVCPKLKILLLHGNDNISNKFFEATKALKVARLQGFPLSLNSLQSLTQLVTLRLIHCTLRDMTSLKMLAKLEILIFHVCSMVELPKELKELNELRILSIEQCVVFKRIPINVMPSLPLLEELHIDGNFEVCEAEKTSVESSNTDLSELRKLHLQEVEYFIDMMQQHIPSTAFSNLVHLTLHSVHLRDICNGGRPPKGFLENLETLRMLDCDRMGCLFPSSLIQRLRKLKKVTIYHCVELQVVFQLEGLWHTSLLSSLECLNLVNLPNLRNIWKGPTQQVSLLSLTDVEVAYCKKLRYVFTLNLARSLLHLEQLKVKDCDNLQHVVEIKAEETKDNVAAGGGNDVLLPKLRILELDGLETLINFCSENYSSTWSALEKLNLCDTPCTPSLVAEFKANLQTVKDLCVENSDEFCRGVLPQLGNNFENLKVLRIVRCGGVQEIFHLEQQICLSSLTELRLVGAKDLERLYLGPVHLLSLPNLQNLHVYNCKRLRHLLSSSLGRKFPQLKTIEIGDCEELEQVMVEDDREDHVQLPVFSNLFSISVAWCGKLKTLFPVTIARLDLQQLTSLRVSNSFPLEELFGRKDEADITGHTQLELVLPQLEELVLYHLESLVDFCPSGYHFIFPSLSLLSVIKCPKITTRFSVDENGAVHAQAEAPHTDNQHVVDIECWGSGEVRQKLPPYIGN